jgi:hypothetical protein
MRVLVEQTDRAFKVKMSVGILRRGISNASQHIEARRRIGQARCVRCSMRLSASIVAASNYNIPSGKARWLRLFQPAQLMNYGETT